MQFWDNILYKIAANIINRKASTTSTLFAGTGDSSGTIYKKHDYDNFAKESYVKNVICYRSILLRAMSVASVPWKLFKENSDGDKEEIKKHSIINLFKRPNPQESFSFIMLQLSAYKSLSGNSYLERISPLTGPNKGIPKELYVLRPDRLEPIIDKNTGILAGYKFKLNGKTKIFPVDPMTLQGDIYQFKNFNPIDDWFGLSDTEPAARQIDTSNMGTDFSMFMFKNQGAPGMVMEYPGKVGENEFKILEANLKRKFSGPQNASKNMILTEGGKAHPFTLKPRELEYIKGMEALARSIAIAYGVFPMLLGIPGEATFANFQEARQAFWEQVIIFDLEYFKWQFNNWFFTPDDNLELDYDLDKVPALEGKRESKWKRANESKFLKINEKREMVGLDAVDEGDVILVSSTELPLGFEEEIPGEEEE